MRFASILLISLLAVAQAQTPERAPVTDWRQFRGTPTLSGVSASTPPATLKLLWSYNVGGPIATAVGHVLGTSAQTTIELNLRIRNTAVTEFAFTPKRHMLVCFNAIPHLDAAQYRDWVTYS